MFSLVSLAHRVLSADALPPSAPQSGVCSLKITHRTLSSRWQCGSGVGWGVYLQRCSVLSSCLGSELHSCPMRTPPTLCRAPYKAAPGGVRESMRPRAELAPLHSLIKEESFSLLLNQTWSCSSGTNDTGQRNPW